MRRVNQFLFVFGLIVLSNFITCRGEEENSVDDDPIEISSKYILRRPGHPPLRVPPRINDGPSRPSHGPPAPKDHPPGTHSPAGSSTAGGSGVGVGRRYTSGDLGAGVN
ncbi:hypothetical protein ABFX02_07G046800 [Erythranthe guttata]